MEQVFGSLELSMLTGPNEGYVMAERAIFGVSLWESLSPDLKRRVAIDLAAAEIAGNEKFRAVRFRTACAGAERAPGRHARNRTFVERGRTTTGVPVTSAKLRLRQLT